MFASNQVFKISGEFDQLESALGFALAHSENTRSKLLFQIADDGKYCIGWGGTEIPKGWNEFQFDFDVSIVAKIIAQHIKKLSKVKSGYEWADGSTGDGFLMKNIPEMMSDKHDGVTNPFYGIVSFEPFCNFYSK